MTETGPRDDPYRHASPLVRGLVSERVVTSVILVNAAALFLGDESPGEHGLIWAIDYVCVLFFVLELALKIRTEGWRSYWASNWNRYDFLTVALSLPLLLTPVITLPGVEAGPILRLGRFFRLVRLMRFIPHLDHLVQGVRRALRASVGVFLALFLINVILAVTGHFLFGTIDPKQFGSPVVSVYTLFQVFTVEGWHEVPQGIIDALEAQGHPQAELWGVIARCFSVLAVLCGGVLGLSLANAVFVDEMTMDNTQGLERKIDALTAEVQALREALPAAPAPPESAPPRD